MQCKSHAATPNIRIKTLFFNFDKSPNTMVIFTKPYGISRIALILREEEEL